ncbi:MAG: DUF5343 domain-containing protein [Actinobacteria bacterium]|nr:DUF5343 domain-containing protein [Actinomycetota bacterium]
MSVTRDGQAPYAPTEAVMDVIDGYRTKHPHTPFTAENIQPLGVSPSIAPRTLQALRLLDLIDGDGNPTAAMDGLREAPAGEFAARLAEVLRAAYPEVFAYKDPASDSPEDMVEVFRFYRPASMQPRMIRVFYGLCARAGIIDAPPAIERSGKSSPRKAPGTKTGTKPQPLVAPPPPPLATNLDQLKTRYVEVLLARLEGANGEFDTDLADRIERLMDVNAG